MRAFDSKFCASNDIIGKVFSFNKYESESDSGVRVNTYHHQAWAVIKT